MRVTENEPYHSATVYGLFEQELPVIGHMTQTCAMFSLMSQSSLLPAAVSALFAPCPAHGQHAKQRANLPQTFLTSCP